LTLQRERITRLSGVTSSPGFDDAVPERASFWTHTCEGAVRHAAHIKASLLGPTLTLPLADGRPALGTWQGIYLCEHRKHGGATFDCRDRLGAKPERYMPAAAQRERAAGSSLAYTYLAQTGGRFLPQNAVAPLLCVPRTRRSAPRSRR